MQKGYILGNPRSGTSLLRIMLNAHSEIASPPECGFMHWWYKKYKDWDASDAKNPKKVEAFVGDLLSSKKIETWALDREAVIDHIVSSKISNYGDLCLSIYCFWSQKHRNMIPAAIVDKNNYYINHLDDLLNIWSDAKFLFLLRDGRDVACSYKDLRNLTTDSPYRPNLPFVIEDIANEWESNNRRIWNFLNSLPRDKWVLVKYEDLVSSAEKQLMEICSFLNIGYDEAMMKYHEKNDEPATTLDWKRKTLEKLDKNNIGKYRVLLDHQDIKRFNMIARDMLLLGGYE